MRLRYALAVCAVSLIPCISLAQGTDVALGALVDSSTLPVQVTADQLEVRQSDGTAVFAGNVLVAQGEMRLTADRVAVEYETENGTPTGQIARMLATGNVLLVNRDEAAEGQNGVGEDDRARSADGVVAAGSHDGRTAGGSGKRPGG